MLCVNRPATETAGQGRRTGHRRVPAARKRSSQDGDRDHALREADGRRRPGHDLPARPARVPRHSRFALIQTGEENYFFWLQSVDEPNLAFVVTDPSIFFKDYEVPIREETRQDLQLGRDRAEAFLQLFVICNKVGDWLTGNLLGPIVVNAQNRLAQQVVLTEKKWTTRQPLIKLQAEVPLAKSA